MNAASLAQTETIESHVNALFGGERMKVPVRFMPDDETGITPEPRVALIRRAKTKELSRVIAFMSAVLGRIPHDKFEMVVALVADLQRGAMLLGKSPQDVEITPEVLIDKWKGDTALILEVLGATLDLLPEFMSIFTDLTEKEGDNLEFDDMTLVMIGIIGANYAFFTQRLRPIMTAVIAAYRRKSPGAKKG